MTPKKWFGALAVATAASIALTGCGRADNTDAEPEGQSAAIGEGPATGDITIWAMGLEGESMPEIAQAFQAENPDAKVTITAVPWDDAPTKISTAIASGQTPDATLINPSALASYVATDGFAPVPEGLVDAADFDTNAFRSTEVNGTNYAVPLYVDTRPLFYRKDLAEKAGVEAPKTWDEWNGFAKALQDAGAKEGMLLPTGELGFTEQVLIPFLWAAGGTLTDQAQSEFTLDTPEVVAGLTQYRSFIEDGVAKDTGTYEPWGSVEQRLADGDIGSVIQGPWLVPALKEILGDEYEDKIGVATLPAGPASGAAWLDGGQLAVFKDAKNAEGAWKFIEFISEPEQAAEFSKLTGDLPAVTAAWEPAGLNEDPTTAVFSDQLADTGTPPAVATWNEVAQVIAGYGEKVARGAVTPQDAAEQMQSELSGIGLE
ncbi:extracellular solute-binding protein [Kineosporia babensis]|uniref:Extracellular solute-binding protein n=1 Tax=Kineosporia babensis TaxID=499548 RepID=A0A9X1SXB0_9ACTN|nr:extracellular solute-binding protein [Kineosporia babensis]MCD5315639.1 extracellular solute-binding protein [Kineosporia babensis]